MCRFLLIILFSLGVQSACAAASSDTELSQRDFVVSEFEKFMELELRDCIAGYDAVLYQEKNAVGTALDLVETENVIALMREGLNRKVGQKVSLEDIRESSSFHISGIYLSDEDGLLHSEYQEKVIDACNIQIERIANQASERAVAK